VTFRIIVWNSVDSYIHTSGIATTDTNTSTTPASEVVTTEGK
jgi:hypothetical protein